MHKAVETVKPGAHQGSNSLAHYRAEAVSTRLREFADALQNRGSPNNILHPLYIYYIILDLHILYPNVGQII